LPRMAFCDGFVGTRDSARSTPMRSCGTRGMVPGLPEKWLLRRPFIGWPTPAWAVSESTGAKNGIGRSCPALLPFSAQGFFPVRGIFLRPRATDPTGS
jgi:hypothetical protein